MMVDRVIDRLANLLSYDDLNDLYSVVDDDPVEFCEKLHEILSEMEESQK